MEFHLVKIRPLNWKNTLIPIGVWIQIFDDPRLDILTLARGVVSVSLRRQPSVTLSCTKAEYVAYCQAADKAVWLRLLLKELGQPRLEPNTLHCDNNSAILLANHPEFHAQTKKYRYTSALDLRDCRTGDSSLEVDPGDGANGR